MDDPQPDSQHKLAHDLRHALFALQTGLELLAHVRQDPERFDEVHGLLKVEVRTASDLLNQLLRESKQ